MKWQSLFDFFPVLLNTSYPDLTFRNWVSIRSTQDSSTQNSDAEIDERSTYIDALASTLARLDEEAYQKAVLRDADSILELSLIHI